MTHDFKGTLEGIEWKMNDGSFTNAEKLAIISALQLAQEAEQLRKENEELKANLDKAKWQPIDTAPRDGTSILVTDGYDVCDAYFRGGDWWQYECGDDWYSTSINPTHWIPLPDAQEQP